MDAAGGARRRAVHWTAGAWGLGAIAAGALLGVLVLALPGFPLGVDAVWGAWSASARGPVGEALARGLDTVGGGILAVFVVPMIAAAALVIARRPWAAVFFLTASILSAGIVQTLKHLLGRARPEDILVVSDYGSFPSGHVANAATMAVALGLLFPQAWVWMLGAAYTALMAASRTYLGAHWLSDTAGGALIGAGAALVAWAVFAAFAAPPRVDAPGTAPP
ncbi:phosphatase PAP2 family protein [Agromyces archimandritae]|uniref:Phosphatase PAP2 family protein n=1 Tax=Agromyces archimandritae TaxID=2781962 RepID=A0A975IMU0_9MICO|nr:phosphatase PAP2 family protein [Agromyces archimandritae]QTX03878.1 phosphatase PAP2 family protein [Agromyces archimandritae]